MLKIFYSNVDIFKLFFQKKRWRKINSLKTDKKANHKRVDFFLKNKFTFGTFKPFKP